MQKPKLGINVLPNGAFTPEVVLLIATPTLDGTVLCIVYTVGFKGSSDLFDWGDILGE